AARAAAARRLRGAAEATIAPLVRASPRCRAAAAAAAALGTLVLYLAIGSPGAPDQPFAGRLAQWVAHPERDGAAELAAVLRSLAAGRPDDPEPLRRLAAVDIALGDANGAVHALRQALEITPDQPGLLAPLGEVLVLEAGGKVGADAQAVFRKVLRLDPHSASARYYLARAQIAAGDTSGGLENWRALLADLTPNDPRRPLLVSDIDTVEKTGALALADAAPPASVLAEAIRGMVEGLAARLKAYPDDPDGWVRLVRAYTALGETDNRGAALAQARRLYAGRPEVLARLAAALNPPPSAPPS
ncbi:MAG: tetratricopeptide repeat protein, partial [Caulobacteraceae bacterium]